MDAHVQAVETQIRETPGYSQALTLLDEEARLQFLLREIEGQLESLGVAGKLARIDRLRQSLAASARSAVQSG
ncbi:hypothetical protein [Denitratisoma oestradiolicum]|uniref:Uncharacterized protein n=1 Tax=Denitratisoma oestradiolicum TaxID=311182 RepID=A0A6S6Y2K5_9PROT|nr:hypothetical protein [Denitratisoma oestradiolicum]CAB1370755.1 conserved protein of unknown function [Denitratisoma oestradiolicum]